MEAQKGAPKFKNGAAVCLAGCVVRMTALPGNVDQVDRQVAGFRHLNGARPAVQNDAFLLDQRYQGTIHWFRRVDANSQVLDRIACLGLFQADARLCDGPDGEVEFNKSYKAGSRRPGGAPALAGAPLTSKIVSTTGHCALPGTSETAHLPLVALASARKTSASSSGQLGLIAKPAPNSNPPGVVRSGTIRRRQWATPSSTASQDSTTKL